MFENEKNLIITYETFSSFGCIKGMEFRFKSPKFQMENHEISKIREILSMDTCWGYELEANGSKFKVDPINKTVNGDLISFHSISNQNENSNPKPTLYAITSKPYDSIFVVCDDFDYTNNLKEKFIHVGELFLDDLKKIN
ncbi:hypothetical protein DDB_G0270474 [Dictyostelium discoideum AX4]|uniref:Uncharacterized protein n=1 Tax=Dictyostelium discoideum TaxID=44689 RepID=Q55EB7_DICDI|nr:hypothetical protein DDB_G0270474 [Dictyostelium discoideum AX4]EAL72587.1 hypothetical protein DDB_G0270474 [Dictyostelium discoideum AX4]|eukprot:XP_645864.1 hypothetical protein DDB_G0270474 [Dictyostelium discoideum AX4]